MEREFVKKFAADAKRLINIEGERAAYTVTYCNMIVAAGESVYTVTIEDVVATLSEIVAILTANVGFLRFEPNDRGIVTLFYQASNSKVMGFVKLDCDESSVVITGTEQFIQFVKDIIINNFELKYCPRILWAYLNGDGSFDCDSYKLDTSHLGLDCFYPWLSCPLREYNDKYIHSSASILLLMGPPGTGKTTFIKTLIEQTQTDAYITYDSKLMEDDILFRRFLTDESVNYLVVEDADTLITSRSSGNHLMRKFLNVADGLLSSPDKKIIFSTNLPNIKDIDSALIRPGRCFDVLRFRPFTVPEAKAVCAELGIARVIDREYSLGELLGDTAQTAGVSTADSGIKNGFGFM